MNYFSVEDADDWPSLEEKVVESGNIRAIEISLNVDISPAVMYNTIGYVVDWWRGERSQQTRYNGRMQVPTKRSGFFNKE